MLCFFEPEWGRLTSLEITLNAINQRGLGTRHYKIHSILLRKSHETRVVISLDIGVGNLVIGTQASATVSGCDVDDVDEGRLAQLPGEGMLTATIANNENAQLFGSHG